MHRHLLHLVLVFVVTCNAVAQQTQRARVDAPRAETLRTHVTYLASDKLEGRRTGTTGAEMAAQYIAREFARYGLRRSVGIDRPGMSILEADSPKRYMQEFPYVAGVELGAGNSMLFTPSAASLDLRLKEDWLPLGFSTNAKVASAPVMFVGYGITAQDLKYDDYAGLDVANRIVMAFAETPDADNPHGEFARYADVRWKAIAARDHGAKALVVIAREENFADDKFSRLSYDNSGGEAGLPVVAISRQVAARILGINSSKALADLQEVVRKNSLEKRGTTPVGEHLVNVNLKFESLKNSALSISTDITRRETPSANVIGILEGSDTKLKNEAIVIGAHYDHLGRGGEGSLAPREGEIHHGADDNASGVAGLLELARLFSSERERPRRTFVFIAFSGEEEGLLGSNFYVNHAVVPLAQTVAMINMDMIGRMREGKLNIGGVGTAAQWKGLIKDAQVSISTNQTITMESGRSTVNGNFTAQPFALTLNEDGYGPSDHSSFYSKQVPVLFFWTGTHEDYHKPSDTADKINYADEARIVSFITSIVRSIGASDERINYTVAKSEATGRSTGFRVYLGTIPNYAESSNGLTLDGVRDDSPAAKAGLKAGDRIVKLAGREIRNVYDYTYALGEMKAGQEYEVEAMRGAELLKLKLTPAARKQ
jgi:Zn-dependent M28 family amino/carboxypeptidase